MNIVITKEEFNSLDIVGPKLLFGSKLYGTDYENSDTDYLCFIKEPDEDIWAMYPIQHQFQYKENNVDYIITTWRQFIRNIVEGDSTINVDIILFSDYFKDFTTSKLEFFRTYKVIKAYIGFAKRDLKQSNSGRIKEKLSHASRGIYTAQCLIYGYLPDIEVIKDKIITPDSYKKLLLQENNIRQLLNEYYQKNYITLYPNIKSDNTLIQKFINGANTKEFKYA